MKLKHHIRRAVMAIVLTSGFILALCNTYNWGFIVLEVIGFLGLCGVIIAIDTAHEYKGRM